MSRHGRTIPSRRAGVFATPAAPPSRINVAVNEVMLGAIDRVIDTDDVTLTEAVRRLLGYGDLVHTVQHAGCTLIVRDHDGKEREVMPLTTPTPPA